jgi:seryl-tRNA synthetase
VCCHSDIILGFARFIYTMDTIDLSCLGVDVLANNSRSKDEALEALDFIVNVLKEHEKDLDKLINELATVTEQLGDAGDVSGKVEKLEEKINNLQKEVASLIGRLSGVSKEAVPALPADREQLLQTQPTSTEVMPAGPSVIVRCEQWEDFQTLASNAQTLSFSYKAEEKVFQVDALKRNQIISYSGVLPKFSAALKIWLSKQLDVPERSILEGVLAIS